MARWPAYILCFGLAAISAFYGAEITVRLFQPVPGQAAGPGLLLSLGLVPPLAAGAVFAALYGRLREGAAVSVLWLGSLGVAAGLWAPFLYGLLQGYVSAVEGWILVLILGFGLGLGLTRRWEQGQ